MSASGDKSGYECPVCHSRFHLCAGFAQHKKATGHGCARCVACDKFIPSKAALKKHSKMNGLHYYDGEVVDNRDCRPTTSILPPVVTAAAPPPSSPPPSSSSHTENDNDNDNDNDDDNKDNNNDNKPNANAQQQPPKKKKSHKKKKGSQKRPSKRKPRKPPSTASDTTDAVKTENQDHHHRHQAHDGGGGDDNSHSQFDDIFLRPDARFSSLISTEQQLREEQAERDRQQHIVDQLNNTRPKGISRSFLDTSAAVLASQPPPPLSPGYVLQVTETSGLPQPVRSLAAAERAGADVKTVFASALFSYYSRVPGFEHHKFNNSGGDDNDNDNTDEKEDDGVMVIAGIKRSEAELKAIESEKERRRQLQLQKTSAATDKQTAIAKQIKSKRKAEGGAVRNYTPFGKYTGSMEEVKFDLQFSTTFVAKDTHNLGFLELIVGDNQDFPPPSEWLLSKMETEWKRDETTSGQWNYVHSTVPESAADREMEEGDERDIGHEGFSIDTFLDQDMAVKSQLNRAEVVALRLYTGPGYKAINASLREGNNDFCATAYTLESAVIKVGQKSRKADVVRGLVGQMNARFKAMYQEGKKLKAGDAIADPGFLSTSRNVDLALTGAYSGDIIFYINGKSVRPGLLRSGADVAWISQFPNEQEILFPQYTELWYGLPERRDDKRFLGVKKPVYQFRVKCPFNEKLNCPNIPGLGK